MAKHYVGARYVPKFASPAEWAPSTFYEALTIVNFNNDSYTSKVPVPPTVGNPANNPQYWALTGNYAQIAANKKALQTPTTVTDPTSKTVLLAGSQGIDYSKLADAIIAKYQGQTLAGKAQSVKSALDTVRSVQDQTIKTEDSSTPCSYSAGDFFVYDGKLYKASADFSSVTLTTDNISQYAEAQTQTAINALNQSLLNRYNDTSLLIDESKIKRWVPDGSEQSYGTVNRAWYWKIGYTVYVDIDIKFNSDSYYAILGLPYGYKPIANSDVTICINGGDLDGKNRSYLRLKPAFVQALAITSGGGRVQIYYNYQAFG